MKWLAGLAIALVAAFVLAARPDVIEAKGPWLEPRMGSVGTDVTVHAVGAGETPFGQISAVFRPQEPAGDGCSAVLAAGVARRADGVEPESWELELTGEVPDVLTCQDGSTAPVRPGLYAVDFRGDFGDNQPAGTVFSVPEFVAGTLGTGFHAHVRLSDARVAALEAAFPGRQVSQDEPPPAGLDDRLVLTLVCPVGCKEDPLAGHETGIVQAFYLPADGLIAFDPYGPFYRLQPELARDLAQDVGAVARVDGDASNVTARPATPEAASSPGPSTSRAGPWEPFAASALASGIAAVAAAFAVGLVLGRRSARRP